MCAELVYLLSAKVINLHEQQWPRVIIYTAVAIRIDEASGLIYFLIKNSLRLLIAR